MPPREAAIAATPPTSTTRVGSDGAIVLGVAWMLSGLVVAGWLARRRVI